MAEQSQYRVPPARWTAAVQLEMFGGDQLEWVFAGPGTQRWASAAWTSIRDDDQGALLQVDPTPEQLEESGQLRLRPFRSKGVQMTFDSWRAQVARNLARIGRQLGGKFGRSLCRQAKDFELCGEWAERKTCEHCGSEKLYLAASCSVRLCPFCERVRAVSETAALVEKFEELRKKRAAYRRPDGSIESYKLRLLTWTLRFDPKDMAEYGGDRMRERRDTLLDFVDQSWEHVLARDPSGNRLPDVALRWSFEVPYGGAIHCHGLYWGPYVDAEALRTEGYLLAGEGNSNADVQALKKRRKKQKERDLIREGCKYLTKGSGPRRSSGLYATREASTRMDPALAAIVLASFKGLHMAGTRGALRNVEERAEELEETVGDGKPCDCGHPWSIKEWVHRSTIKKGELQGVGRFNVKDWKPPDLPRYRPPSARELAEAINGGVPP